MKENNDLLITQAPPVMEARKWLVGLPASKKENLINVSQAAPVDPPPLALREAMAHEICQIDGSHLYGPVQGREDLRVALSENISHQYHGDVTSAHVTITSGCNQAFCATIACLAQKGDAVLLPVPWYFNHQMHLSMSGIEIRPLLCGDDMLPDIEAAEQLIDKRLKAIVLVSPNNPTGVEYPKELVRSFYELAKKHNIALVLDETYRDFDSRSGPAHDLFQDKDWHKTLVHLYSFSKAYRLTGHRIGALVAGEALQNQVEKYIDTQTICPNQIGQFAALWGINHLGEWLLGERAEILSRKKALISCAKDLTGWTLKGCGAYFAYLQHPFEKTSDEIAKLLLKDAGVLMLPGTMFSSKETEKLRKMGNEHLRVAFANIDADGISTLFERLSSFDP